MKQVVETWACDLCKRTTTFTDPSEVSGWRSLRITLSGSPYPEFEGDLCGECVQKVRGYFAELRTPDKQLEAVNP